MHLLGAHAVAATRVYAVARVSGVLLVAWATTAGLYLFLGGVNHLSNPIFAPLITAVGGYQVVGGVLAVGGFLGLIGLMFKVRWLSIMSCVLCAAWSGAVAVFLFIAAAHGFDNLASWFATLCFALYTLRFYLLVETPDPDEAIHLR